jgi:diguanylate cyclase (GGDEF)-like protein
MPERLRPVLLVVLFVALYWGGILLADHLIVGPDAVVLLWPPGALAFVLLLREGRRRWWMIVLAEVVSALFWIQAPLVFLPFALAANLAGAFAAVTLARRLGLHRDSPFDLGNLHILPLGGLTLALASLPFGLTGLLLTGMSPPEAAGAAALKWLTANTLGVVLLAPCVWLLWPTHDPRPPPPAPPLNPLERLERGTWSAALLASLAAVGLLPYTAVANAAAMAALPGLVLLWGAIRLPARWAAGGCLVSGLILAILAATDTGALREPQNTVDALILVVLLFTLTLAPLVLMAAVAESRRTAAEMLRRSRTDPLTGLPNRGGLQHRAGKALEAAPADLPMLLLYLDIDNFERINDAAGLTEGDRYLQAIAARLREALGPDDLLGRLDTDRFVLLLHGIPAAQAEARAEALRRAAGDYRHPCGDRWLSSTASVGGIGFAAGENGYDSALALAAAACAAAKEQGGDRCQLTDARSGNEAVAERRAALGWATRVDQALQEGRFRLFGQSIVPFDPAYTGGRHLEILVRMVEPSSGELLTPEQFVPAAERFKLGPKLDRHVLDRTLAWLERNPAALAQVELCAINLCAASVNDPAYLAFLRERLARSTVPPERLCLEITETSAVRDFNEARSFIAAARKLGVRLALDDFGAGFSSFAYLSRLEVDFIKIDGGFSRDIEHSVLSVSIVRAITEIARILDKRTIAEFVENDAIRRRLTQLGVDYGQGYGIDHPRPIEQFFHRPAPLFPRH